MSEHERTVVNERFAQAMYEAALHDRSLNYPDSDPLPAWDDLPPMAKYQWRAGALHVSTDFLEIVEQVVGHRIWEEGHTVGGDMVALGEGYTVETVDFDNPYPEVL